MIVTSITEFRDTTVTNYRNTTSSIDLTTTFVSDAAENPLTQNCDYRTPETVQVITNNTTIYDYGPNPVTMAVEMQGTVTRLSSHTMCVQADRQCLQEIDTDGSAERHRTPSTSIQWSRF